jgi:hypothetical protein
MRFRRNIFATNLTAKSLAKLPHKQMLHIFVFLSVISLLQTKFVTVNWCPCEEEAAQQAGCKNGTGVNAH